jgi:hypothetical protein
MKYLLDAPIEEGRKTSSQLARALHMDQVSQPHRSMFMGVDWNRRYLLQISRWGQFHIVFRAPMDWDAALIRLSMSYSSRDHGI